MSTSIQPLGYFDAGFGNSLAVNLPATADPDSTIVMIVLDHNAISSVVAIGPGGSATLSYSVTPAGSTLMRWYHFHTGANSNVTGLQVTYTSGDHQLIGFIGEYGGVLTPSPVDDTAVMDGDFTDTAALAGGLDTTEDDGLVVACFVGGAIGDVASTNAGFTNFGGATAYIAQHNVSPGAAGNKTPGFVLTGSTSLFGSGVAYLPAPGGGVPPTFGRRQDAQHLDETPLGYRAMLNPKAWA